MNPQASLPPTTGVLSGIVSETTIGSFSNTMDLPREWTPNHFSLQPFHYGNLIDETVGLSHSNSTSISSEGTHLISRAAGSSSSKKPFFKLPPMSRQERVLRYFEKKKARKYVKKIQYSSRKTYAQTRPRLETSSSGVI
ncbi:CCT domain-containing protein [Cynara cardunculus var. scolymus]|uniref:CCT domain-containing protein n=1 Tax=Cynara cardunculus var. scolymus TaxID=59895 RepID=A0A103XBT9_CYNCS|nr:CCT domain-containing protein [Cynara cardunculus var. scolymus]